MSTSWLDPSHVLGKPDVYVKGEPCYTERRCNDAIAKYINTGGYFLKKGKKMSEEYETAYELVVKAQEKFDKAINHLYKTEQEISEKTKKVSENVRQATTKLNEGLARIEKQANFDKLERYVELLERAELAMSALAAIEETGKLKKITDALS